MQYLELLKKLKPILGDQIKPLQALYLAGDEESIIYAGTDGAGEKQCRQHCQKHDPTGGAIVSSHRFVLLYAMRVCLTHATIAESTARRYTLRNTHNLFPSSGLGTYCEAR